MPPSSSTITSASTSECMGSSARSAALLGSWYWWPSVCHTATSGLPGVCRSSNWKGQQQLAALLQVYLMVQLPSSVRCRAARMASGAASLPRPADHT